MKIHSQTHIGLGCKINEDRHLVKQLPDGSTLLLVADGLGGNVCGGVAAEIIKGHFESIRKLKEGHEQTRLADIAVGLDRRICDKAEQGDPYNGMGSTLICALIRKNVVHWAHVGDSRLYHYHKGDLRQITEDQTLARFLLKEGEITPDEYKTHYSRRIMDQHIGCGAIEPETGRFAVEPGDLIALVSDGLYRYVSVSQARQIISRTQRIKDRAGSLIAAALENGGNDNITIVLVEI